MPDKVVFSDRAYIALLAETKEKIRTETGGVFLGHKRNDTWYIIEAIDPGPKSIFEPSYFEYDDDYISHLGSKLNRLYCQKMSVLGLWHRHPGSFDSFSATDDGTNTKFAEIEGNEAISAIVNVDNDFRLTMYSVRLPLAYKKIPTVVGDHEVPEEFLEYHSPTELEQSLNTRHKHQKQRYRPLPTGMSFGSAVLDYLANKSKARRIFKSLALPEPQSIDYEDILETMQIDIDFLDAHNIEYNIKANPRGGIDIWGNDASDDGHPVVLSFCQDRTFLGKNLNLELDGKTFKYRAGLIKKACMAHASKNRS